jgi:LysR family nitrogen assimilation transcriptional regulator
MDLKQLEYFVRVAELGSFTRAAQALNVAQPALSRQVRLLEVELRQNLLVRNGRGATPTQAGLLLLEHGRGILHQVERAREELGRVRTGLTGRVALGLPPSVARVLTVPLTRAFRLKMPDAQLSISEGLSSAMQENLQNGRLDIAVLYNPSQVAGIEHTPLGQEELLLVQPRPPGLQEDPPPPAISLQEVAALPLVIPTRPNAIRMHVESEMAAIGCRPLIAPGPGGRRCRLRHLAAQRRHALGAAIGVFGAAPETTSPVHPTDHRHQRTTPQHPHPASRLGPADRDGSTVAQPALKSAPITQAEASATTTRH